MGDLKEIVAMQRMMKEGVAPTHPREGLDPFPRSAEINLDQAVQVRIYGHNALQTFCEMI